ncbi:putative transporterc [Vanrija pseudolonga]|uniref:Purtative transporterc n=1 Tax=Vanrija pseudolonga TaxID=143232 RepID=A0AAF1BIQ4_9TREE|nr:purtative transporterc [Vanrija pseudolonga]
MWIVMPALGLVAFIAALDQTIIATALPTIAGDLHATPSQYSWVGTSYLLAQTVMTPINGRVTDIIGRKPALYGAIMFLLVFSALCGAAKSIEMTIVISDIVPLDKVGMYNGNLGVAWGAASCLGPLLGGLLTDRLSWRWCFYINLPICGLSLILLFFALKLNPTPPSTLRSVGKTFDFAGLALVMAATGLIIVGFSTAADEGFGHARSYGVIAAGAVVGAGAIVYEFYTKRNPIIPPRMLRTRTVAFFLFGSFSQSFIFVSAGYILPQFFQGVHGSTALSAGVQLLPFAMGASLFGVLAGQITGRFRIVRPVIWTGYLLAGVGYLLFYGFYTSTVSFATQEGLQIITATGIGLSLSPPILVIQAAMPFRDMAAATSTWVLARSLGATIGLAVFGAILNAGIRQRFARIPGYGVEFVAPESSAGYRALHELADGETKTAVLKAFADSVRMCFAVGAAFLLFAFVLTLFTKSYSLDRVKRRDAESSSSQPDSPADDTHNALRHMPSASEGVPVWPAPFQPLRDDGARVQEK